MTVASKTQHGWFWHLIVLGIGFVVVYTLSTIHESRTDAYVAFAAWLQFIGVLTVARGIADLRKEAGLPLFLTELRSELRDGLNRLRGRREGRVAVSVSAIAMSGTGTATARAGVAPTANIEQRFEHIEREIDNLYTTARNLDARITEESTAKAQATRALKEETERRQKELWDKFTGIATGGIRLETVGLVWVAVGSILPAFPSLAYVLWPVTR